MTTADNSKVPGFTPGPWAVADQHPTRAVLEIVTGHHQIAALYCAPDPDGSGYCEGSQDGEGIWGNDHARRANARLIAAAPELFEALKKIIERANTDAPGTSKVRDMEAIAAAALTKATGEATP